jgi:hypothetical protein
VATNGSVGRVVKEGEKREKVSWLPEVTLALKFFNFHYRRDIDIIIHKSLNDPGQPQFAAILFG